MQVRWETEALDDLTEIRAYIATYNESSANTIAQKTLQATERLQAHPLLGKAGRVYPLRELLVSGTNYTLIYLAEPNTLSILRVFHQARSWEKFMA